MRHTYLRDFTDRKQFIIEGIITVLIAVGGWFFLVPFPDDHPERSWNFLNEREVAWVVARVEADRADTVTEPFQLVKFLRPGADPKVSSWEMSTRRKGSKLIVAGLGLRADLLLPDYDNLRPGVLPPYHSPRGNGIQHWRGAMSCHTPVCVRRHYYGPLRMGGR